MQFDRGVTEKLLHEWTEGGGLRAHARGVEACIRVYARLYKTSYRRITSPYIQGLQSAYPKMGNKEIFSLC
jgi:hypothetical protein